MTVSLVSYWSLADIEDVPMIQEAHVGVGVSGNSAAPDTMLWMVETC